MHADPRDRTAEDGGGPAHGHAVARSGSTPHHRLAPRRLEPGACLMVNAFRPSRHSARAIRVSFEFFPPKTPEMEATLWASIERLAPLSPQFVSVTYGAGGSTRERTHNTVERLVRETPLKPAAHLTCVAATKDEVGEVVRSYRDAGVRHIVALRGDPAGGVGTAYEPHPGGYRQTCDLVAGIKEIGNFEVSV